jgi:hypothetical protein
MTSLFIFWNIFQVQQCIEFLVDEALRMGAHPDDRDSVTDMTFLMFTCKAGAAGVGDGTMAAKVLKIWVTFMCPRNELSWASNQSFFLLANCKL